RRGRGVRRLRPGPRLRDPLGHLVLENRAGLQLDDPPLADGHRPLRRGGAGRAADVSVAGAGPRGIGRTGGDVLDVDLATLAIAEDEVPRTACLARDVP